MAKTPKHEDTDTGAAEQNAPQSNELATALAALERDHGALGAAHAKLQEDHAGVVRQLVELEAENASLKEERANQHATLLNMYAELKAMRAPPASEKVITARNVRNYGE